MKLYTNAELLKFVENVVFSKGYIKDISIVINEELNIPRIIVYYNGVPYFTRNIPYGEFAVTCLSIIDTVLEAIQELKKNKTVYYKY